MIRKAEVKDVFQIKYLEEKTLKATLGTSFIIQELEDNPFSYYLVYEINNKIVGYLSSRIIDFEVEILNVVVDDDYQRQQIGTKLCNYLIENNEIKEITLEVRKSNKIAKNFYSNLGFYKIGIRKNYYENNEDAYILKKEVE